jgi:hypothetical protein
MKLIVSLMLCFMAVPAILFAQKQTTHVQQFWAAYMNQTRFSGRWGLWADFHIRTKEDFFTNFSTSITRVGLTYYANDQLKLTAGYAYVNHFPDDNLSISRPEHRPWQQVQWHNNSKRSRITQALRLEERYRRKVSNGDALAEGYNFNWRTRYNFIVMLPLTKNGFQKNALSFVFNDEVHINFGKEIVNNYFDQNRLFVGFAYHVNATDNIQFGYMNLFQQLPAGNKYRSLHVPRVSYFHNLDLRKK